MNTPTTVVVVIGLVLSGCAGHDFKTPGATGYQFRDSILNGSERLRSSEGTFVFPNCPSVVRNQEWVTMTCVPVTIQATPPGAEAYSYIFKVKIRGPWGIPAGEVAAFVYVVGDKAECLARSAEHQIRTDGRVNEGNLRLSENPAERCVGPVWVRW